MLNDMPTDPWVKFKEWFADAHKTTLRDPNAFVLSTIDEQGQPLDVASYTCVMSGYAARKSAQMDKIGEALAAMMSRGIEPNERTYNAVMLGLVRSEPSRVEEAERVLDEARELLAPNSGARAQAG